MIPSSPAQNYSQVSSHLVNQAHSSSPLINHSHPSTHLISQSQSTSHLISQSHSVAHHAPPTANSLSLMSSTPSGSIPPMTEMAPPALFMSQFNPVMWMGQLAMDRTALFTPSAAHHASPTSINSGFSSPCLPNANLVSSLPTGAAPYPAETATG